MSNKKIERHWIIEDCPEGSVSTDKWKAWLLSLKNLPNTDHGVVRAKKKAQRRISMLNKLEVEAAS